jgi:hypothetical protein
MDEITAPIPPLRVSRLGPPPLVRLDQPVADATVMLVSSAGVHP